ncbi:hypothetical protein ACYFX5_11845 [Bremerella sp. T1]|uniref:hypothetical protein n=1 Tax=Bremerella sp. TYQ1 TaxID=3119568 RepID=UPI001CCA3AFD|nr:hypothetical protein [Bremerella volcania]UBM33765.1 hypothetical protein LA756_13790 [Bremerella volcania]
MTEYFHATVNIHKQGAVISVPTGSTSNAYKHAVSQGKQWVEIHLEALRNGRATDRQFAVYASDTPANAALFAISQNSGVTVHVYEVTPDIVNPSPMAVIGHLGTKTAAFAQLPLAIDEYWEPQMNWSFLEYPANQLTVIQEIPLPDAIALASAQYAYGNDCQLAKHTWP